jgi:hypothetical protein
LLESNYPQHCKFSQQKLWTAQTPLFHSWPLCQECTVSSQDKLGLSTKSYSHSQNIQWNRARKHGQTKLIETQEGAASGAVFTSPDKSQSVRILSVSFVDDTNAAVTVSPHEQITPLELIEKATADAQRWNDMLAATSGALEIQKFKFHLAFNQFSACRAPVLAPLVSQDPHLLLTIAIFLDPTATPPQNLEYLRPGQPRKTLGCYKCPSGNPKPGLETLLQKAIDKSSLIQNSCLDPRATHTYYFAVLLPSLSYTLPVSHYSNQALDTVDKKIAIPFLNKLGYLRSTPRPVQYGPLKYAYPLKDIQGSGQILQCLKHLWKPLVVQRLWLIALH